MASTIHTAVLGVTLSLALIAACGGDTSVETGDGGEGAASASSGDSSSSSGSSGETSSTGSSGQQNACGADSVNADDECEVCIATQCTAEALACCQAPGCLDLVRCAADKGCDGVDCFTPDMCQAEIETAGFDVAQGEATSLGACAIEQCAVECGQDSSGAGGSSGGGGAGGN